MQVSKCVPKFGAKIAWRCSFVLDWRIVGIARPITIHRHNKLRPHTHSKHQVHLAAPLYFSSYLVHFAFPALPFMIIIDISHPCLVESPESSRKRRWSSEKRDYIICHRTPGKVEVSRTVKLCVMLCLGAGTRPLSWGNPLRLLPPPPRGSTTLAAGFPGMSPVALCRPF